MSLELHFALKDIKSSAFLSPFKSSNRFTAIRELTNVVNDNKQGMLNHFPEDFQLFQVAEFDTNTGKFIQPEQPEYVITLSDLKKGKENAN